MDDNAKYYKKTTSFFKETIKENNSALTESHDPAWHEYVDFDDLEIKKWNKKLDSAKKLVDDAVSNNKFKNKEFAIKIYKKVLSYAFNDLTDEDDEAMEMFDIAFEHKFGEDFQTYLIKKANITQNEFEDLLDDDDGDDDFYD